MATAETQPAPPEYQTTNKAGLLRLQVGHAAAEAAGYRLMMIDGPNLIYELYQPDVRRYPPVQVTDTPNTNVPRIWSEFEARVRDPL